MKSLFLLFVSMLAVWCAACDKAELNTRPAAEAELRQLHTEILALANSVSCTDPSEWAFTALGSKACGGPTSYIAYAKNSDSQRFLALVEKYTETQQAFNQKYGTISDCMAVMPPSSICCENNRPVLINQ